MEYVQEVRELPAIAKEIVSRFHAKTPRRLKLVDYFIIFLAALTLLQLVYYAAIGRHPFEALLAGMYTTLGTMIFTGMSPMRKVGSGAENAHNDQFGREAEGR